MTPTAEVFAIRLGSVVREAGHNFLFPTSRTGPMPLDFFLWVIKGQDSVTVVDTGFSQAAGHRRGRTLEVDPVTAVQALGIEPDDVDRVVITHLHYDHAGNLDAFPTAELHIQTAEVAYATGRYMRHESLQHFFEGDDVACLAREIHRGRVRFHDGDTTLLPGVSLHLIGGHTDGLQAVRVQTERGPVVLAADAVHYHENLDTRNPFPSIFNVGRMLEGFDRIVELAATRSHVIPGHDPDVLKQYPRIPSAGVDAVALHRPPVPLTGAGVQPEPPE